MLARTFAPALFGTEGQIVSIECDITNGLPGFIIVGLGDKAVEESREHVRSAIKNSGLMLPPRRLTLNLAPADMPKDGSGYDVGMASLFLGELALDGSIRPVKGVLMAAQIMSRHKLRRIFVPRDNSTEAALISDIKVFAVDNLLQLYRHLVGDSLLSVVDSTTNITRPQVPPLVDLSSIYGQSQAKRAVEIAAAGGHNIIMSGPPGTGKTQLAKAIMGLLPVPNLDEMIEITKLHNLVGRPSGIMS